MLLFGQDKGFRPPQIANISLWFDAADTNTITSNVGAVSQWNDKSGNASNATQGTGSAQPGTGVVTQNGKNVLTFDGGDTLILPAATYTIPNANNTLFVVSSTSLPGTQERVIGMAETASGRWHFQYPSAAASVSYLSSTSSGVDITISSGVTKSNYNIFTCFKSGTTQSISYNGATAVTNASGANESGIDSATIGSELGTVLFLTGAIAEIIVYSRALSTAEINQVNRYLSNKWGITLS